MRSTLGDYLWRGMDTQERRRLMKLLVYDLNATDPVFVFTIDTATH